MSRARARLGWLTGLPTSLPTEAIVADSPYIELGFLVTVARRVITERQGPTGHATSTVVEVALRFDCLHIGGTYVRHHSHTSAHNTQFLVYLLPV